MRLPEAQVVAQHEAGEHAGAGALGAGARRGRRRHLRVGHVGAGVGGVAHRLERGVEVVVARLARRPPCAATAASSSRARRRPAGRSTRTAKSKRGLSSAPWFGSWKSSSRLMPPQKATRPSTTQSLRCRRRQRRGSSTRQPRAGLKTRHCDAGRLPARLPLRRDVAGAEAVDDDPHPHAARGGALERLGDRERRAGELEDVGLEQDLGAGRVDRLRPARRTAPRRPSAASARWPGLQRARRRCIGRPRCQPCASHLASSSSATQRQVVGHARPGGAARHRGRPAARSRACRCGPSRTAACATGRC